VASGALLGVSALVLHQEPNGGNVVYSQQIVAELLEYAYALHTRVAEAARIRFGDPGSSRASGSSRGTPVDHRSPCACRRDSRSPPPGYAQIGIPELKEEIVALLNAKNDLVSYEESQPGSSWSTLLTFVFDLLAVPSIATDILTRSGKS
jgi:hypothetical protein